VEGDAMKITRLLILAGLFVLGWTFMDWTLDVYRECRAHGHARSYCVRVVL